MTETGVRSPLNGPDPGDAFDASGGEASAGGWYADPLGEWPLRWWSGSSWTVWVSDTESVHVGPMVSRRHLQRSDLSHLRFVEGIFLPELAAHGGLTAEQARRAQRLIEELASEMAEPLPGATRAAWETSLPVAFAAPASTAGPAAPGTTAAPGTAAPPYSAAAGWQPGPVAPPSAVPQRAVPSVRPSEPPPQVHEPGPLSRWWQRTRESVRSDLALHGVAYLGVLLFFVGAFGLVAFAFGDVQPGLRPVAEIVIALVPFGAAALLLRRGAVIVGRALEVAGGLLLPVMIITSFLDGVGFPPDLTGAALVVALTAACALLAGAYALWSLRHRDSAIRYVVAPMAWLTAAMASLGLGRPIPSGEGVVVPGSAQVAVILAALVASIAWARRYPNAHLAEPTATAAVPGTLVVGMLTLLTWVREPDPWPAAILIAGALGVAAVELLAGAGPRAGRVPTAWAAVIAPAWWAAAVVAAGAATSLTWSFAVGVLGFLALIELSGRTARAWWALAVPALGAVLSGIQLVDAPWLALGVLVIASAWALARRIEPFQVAGARAGLDITAIVLPLGALAALSGAWLATGALLLGAALLVPASIVARRSADRFWTTAWGGWLLALTCATAAVLGVDSLDASAGSGPWLLVASAALLTLASAAGPLPPGPATGASVALGAWTWLLVCWAAPFADGARGVVLASAAAALVVAAHVRRVRGTGVAVALGASGHLLGLVALALSGAGWGLVTALGLATVGWAITTLADARGASPVGSALARVSPVARYAPPAALSAGIVTTTVTGLWVASPGASDRSIPLALSLLALAMAVAVRVGLPPRLSRTFGWAAFALPIAALVPGEENVTRMVALVALIATVVALPTGVRWRGMTWVAWAAPAPLAGLAAAQWWAGLAEQPLPTQASAVLLAVGGTLLVGAATADLRFGAWAPRWRPRTPVLTPPATLGAAEVLASLALLPGVTDAPASGWLLVCSAGVLLAVALLARIGSLAGVSAVLAWAGAWLLVPSGQDVPALVGTAAAAALLALAEVGHRVAPERAWWSRWDVPLALAAGLLAAFSVGLAWGTAEEVAADVIVGLMALAAAIRLRALPRVAVPLTIVGVALVLAGAATAGPWWFAAALAGLAALLTAAAAWTSGILRRVLQLAGALTAAAAWAATIAAAEWSPDTAASITLWGAGVACLAVAGLARAGLLGPSWVHAWGGLFAAAVVCVAAVSWGGASGLEPTAAVVAGLALLAAALLTAAAPLRLPWLRDSATAAGLAALLSGLHVLGATPTAWVLSLAAVGAAGAVGTLLLGPDDRRTAVPGARRMTVEIGLASTATALAIALATPDSPVLWMVALAAGSVQAAAVGTALRSLPVQALSPLLACAAWLVFAWDAFAGQVELYTAPVGLTLLITVGLWRRDRSQRGQLMASTEIIAVEVVGVVLLVGASLVLMVTESLVHVLPALAAGIGVAAWGAITRVRRRVVLGAGTVVVALLLVIGVPMVRLLPEWQGAGLWILLLGLGIAALLVAALIERGRAAARTAVRRFREITADWE